MPSLTQRLSFATLRARFKSKDSDGSDDPDLQRVRKTSRSVLSLSGRRSETLPPEGILPTIPYKTRSNDVPLSVAADTIRETPVGCHDNAPPLHQRAMSMPMPSFPEPAPSFPQPMLSFPQPLPLDKPVPPLPPPSPITYTVASPDSFGSLQSPPSSYPASPTLAASSPQLQTFSPRAMSMPVPSFPEPAPSFPQPMLSFPQPLPLDKPVPPLPPPSPITYTVASPDSFGSLQSPPSSYPASPTLAASSPQLQTFSPVMNLHAAGILSQVDAGPKSTKAEKLLNKLDDAIASSNDPKGLVSTGIATVKAVLDSSGALKAIEAGVNSFVDDIPWLMKGLDEVAKIHPVVTVAVLAFKAVYTMEMTRRENDKRIRSLYVEMKEMIAVLIQLKDVKDPKDVGPDGKTIAARMQSLCEKAADNIKECANACDSYTKKRLVVKVLKGHSWEVKLVGFVGTFTQRKTDFQQALAIHTARTVDAIQGIVSDTQVSVAALDQKMDLFFKMFALNIPKLELDMRSKMQEKGDPDTVLNNDVALKALNDYENEIRPKQGSNVKGGERIVSEFTVKDLKDELHENVDAAVNENFQIFERKFLLHQNQLQEQLTKSIHEVIIAVREGPHDKIKNPELKEMWKEMNWRRNVKASLFVMTLRDLFREKGEENSNGMEALEDWALKYIDATWLQSIMEAFDDDASGYITVVELNRFTDALPDSLGWSLPHWIAYWAVGWQLTTQKYKTQIEEIMDKMFSFVAFVLPENRKRVEYYLSMVWKFVSQIIQGLNYPNEAPEHVAEKFTAYVEHEEDRLRKNLELIKYDIDALDTMQVVAGGKIEKHILPMMYLLLSRDFKLFRVAQTKVLHDEELWDAADSLMWLNDAAVYRMRDLTELFQQRKLDTALQLKKFACGIFDYMNDSTPLWSMSKLKEPGYTYRRYTLEELSAEPEFDEEGVLNYAIKTTTAVVTEAFDASENNGVSGIPDYTPNGLHRQGTWCGNNYNYTLEEFPVETMDTFHFNPDNASEPTFAYSYTEANEIDPGPFKLSGSCSKGEDGVLKVTWQVEYEEGKGTEHFIGHFDEQGSIVGYRSWSEDVSEAKHDTLFIYRRIPAEVMVLRPSPSELSANKYRALWQFAIKYARREVTKKAWSWSYFAERRRIRERYIKLNIQHWWYGRSLTDEEHVEFLECRKALTTAESLFYRSIREYAMAIMPKHQ
ncbi:hypothetical protein EIP91_002675 [Steccherinum ochraceum]|uniref:EF-hand domain-containing protein n=1 Tax=Steccherinum ochraceum TaxID=92696 RepID=A0A4R0RBW1_9APHY|nr:hypothetical protein EIP91_002675 [Steccherinum ochraceum]